MALLDMTDNSAQCPPGLCLNTTPPGPAENVNMTLLALLMFSHVYINYTKVCGKKIGYQIGSLMHLVED